MSECFAKEEFRFLSGNITTPRTEVIEAFHEILRLRAELVRARRECDEARKELHAEAVCDCHAWPTVKEFHEYTVAVERERDEARAKCAEAGIEYKFPEAYEVVPKGMLDHLAALERVLDMVAKCCYPTNFMFQVEKIREALSAVGNLSPGLPESLREAARVAAEHLETRPDMTEGDAAISSMLRAALAASYRPEVGE